MLYPRHVNHAIPVLRQSLLMHWGERLKEVRKPHGLTQQDVAAFAGVTKGAVSQWEGGGNIKPGNLFAVADRLRIEARWLATGDGPRSILEKQAETSLEIQLVALYRGLPDNYRSMLLADANKYYADAHPNASIANPFGQKQPAKFPA